METLKKDCTSQPKRILVVDDDSTCLNCISGMLKHFEHEGIVVIATDPLDALTILHSSHDPFDLVLSDVHMPIMNGIELQKLVEQDFQIPVVLMSSDDNKSVLLEGLRNGAAFFMMKPLNPYDLKNIWQFAHSKRKGKESQINSKRKFPTMNIEENVETNIEEENTPTNPKKPKLLWTPLLHNKFLEAVHSLGLQRAVPKKILEYMSVPGLTRENVASHLQKYRLNLKRKGDVDGLVDAKISLFQPLNWNEKPFRSTTYSWSQLPTSIDNNFQQTLTTARNVGLPASGGLSINQVAVNGMQHLNTYNTDLGDLSLPITNTNGLFGYENVSFPIPKPNNNFTIEEMRIPTTNNNNVLGSEELILPITKTNNELLMQTNIFECSTLNGIPNIVSGHMNVLESSKLGVQAQTHASYVNNETINFDELTAAAMQFLRPTQNANNIQQEKTFINVVSHNEGHTFTQMGATPIHEPKFFDYGGCSNLVDNMNNALMGLTQEEIDNQIVNSFLNDDDGGLLDSIVNAKINEETRSEGQEIENNFVEKTAALPNLDGNSDHQVHASGTEGSVVPPLQKLHEEELPGFEFHIPPNSVEDWTLKLDDFQLDGIDDLVVFLSNYDSNIESMGQLP